jgi:hypothetical protein
MNTTTEQHPVIVRSPAKCPACGSMNVAEVEQFAWYTVPLYVLTASCVVGTRMVWVCQDCKCEFK